MTHYFSVIDYVLMGLYLTVLVALGLHFRRKASNSLEDYILGGRKIPWWIMGVSGMANMLDLSGTALIISFMYLLGPRGLFIEFRGGACLILVFLMLWTGKWHRRSGCLTAAEWNIFRFGDNWGGRFAEIISVVAAFVGTIGMLAYLFIGVGVFMAMFLPFSPMVCALILMSLATLYIMVSGFYGVVYTDLFQAVIILVMIVYFSVSAFMSVPDAASLGALAYEVTGNSDWISARPTWRTYMPPGYEIYSHLLLFMGFYLLRNIIGGMGTGADPKYFGARSERDCGLLTCWWTFLLSFRWPMMIGVAIIGLTVVQGVLPDAGVLMQACEMIKTHHPDTSREGWMALLSTLAGQSIADAPAELVVQLKALLGEADFSSKLKMITYDGTVNPERILPLVLQFGVARGIRGVIVIALVAAALSTFGGSVNATAGMMVRNVYQRYVKKTASTRELIYAGWISVLILVGLAFAFALSLRSINDVWAWIVMGLGSGLMVPALLRLYWWRFNGGGFFWGTLGGMVSAIVQRILWRDMPESHVFFFTMAVGLIASILGTLMTRQTESGVLKNFYLKTRPFGVWGHLKRELPEAERVKVSREHANDLMALPFALLWQVSLFLVPMLVVVHNWHGFWWCLGLLAAGSVGLYFFWYRKLPAENWYE